MVYYNTIKQLFKNNTDKLSTEQATRTLKKELETYAQELAEESSELADHAERKTIQAKDVEKAIQNLNK